MFCFLYQQIHIQYKIITTDFRYDFTIFNAVHRAVLIVLSQKYDKRLFQDNLIQFNIFEWKQLQKVGLLCLYLLEVSEDDFDNPLYFFGLQLMSTQQLRQQNKKLKQLRATCEEQLDKLREVGRTHETQIDTLLKFNERLLGIIENEFNSATKSKISSELQIINEANEAPIDLASGNKLKTKLVDPPRIGGGLAFEQQDLDGFQDEQEEEIYNQQTQRNPTQSHQPSQQASQQPPPQPTQPSQAHSQTVSARMLQPPKIAKLDRVFQMQHKDEEVSINLSNSASNPTSSIYNKDPQQRQNQPQQSAEVQQLKEMVKQYRQEFVDNSAEYEQICDIIHSDLVNDLNEFRKIEEQSRQFFRQRMAEVGALRNEIKKFKPINELVRVMKKLNVPAATERILNQRIVAKHA